MAIILSEGVYAEIMERLSKHGERQLVQWVDQEAISAYEHTDQLGQKTWAKVNPSHLKNFAAFRDFWKGMEVEIDPAIPDGEIQYRDRETGKVLGKITNVGEE